MWRGPAPVGGRQSFCTASSPRPTTAMNASVWARSACQYSSTKVYITDQPLFYIRDLLASVHLAVHLLACGMCRYITDQPRSLDIGGSCRILQLSSWEFIRATVTRGFGLPGFDLAHESRLQNFKTQTEFFPMQQTASCSGLPATDTRTTAANCSSLTMTAIAIRSTQRLTTA